MLGPFGFDQYLLAAFTHQLPGYKWFFYTVTQAGSSLVLTILASLAFMLGKNKLKAFAAILLVGMLFSPIVVGDLKDIFERPRPPGPDIPDYLIPTSYSFPSGHATAIFLAVSVLGAYYGWKYYADGYVLAIAVGLSRLYLGVHYPSDVVAGAILGTILGELLVYAAYRYGLCDSAGLASCVLKPAEKRPQVVFGDPGKILSTIVFLAASSAAIAYSLNSLALTVSILAAASMLIILYVVLAGIKVKLKMLMAFVLLAIGLITALSLLFLGAYVQSLAIVLIAYIATMALKAKTLS